MKNLFALLFVGVLLFVGCSDEEDEGTSQFSGMWAYIANIRNGQEISTDIIEIYEISGSKLTYQMFSGSDKNIPTYSDGYFIGYKELNFELMGPFNILIQDSHLSISGLMDVEFQNVSADKMLLWECASPNKNRVQRVKWIK